MRDWMTVSEYAEKCRVSTETVRRWCRAGKIKCCIYSKKQGYRISSDPLTGNVINNPVIEKMCSRVKELRQNLRMTQEELGSLLGVSNHVYSAYERGRQEMPATIIVSLADIFGISADYILGISDYLE